VGVRASVLNEQSGELFQTDPLRAIAAAFAGWARRIAGVWLSSCGKGFAKRQVCLALAEATGSENLNFEYEFLLDWVRNGWMG